MKTAIVFKLLAAIIAIAILGSIYYVWRQSMAKPVACTLEAKVCPDGSTVVRVGPNCEFAACPPTDPTASWQTFSDNASGVSFRYPQTLGTAYVSTVDWPPIASIIDQPFTCTQAGSEIAPAGQTKQQTINNRAYCVTKESQGAAGSIYTQYAYAFAGDSVGQANKTVIFTFSLRFVQCANYDDPQKIACQNEQASFSPDNTMDEIAGSLRISR